MHKQAREAESEEEKGEKEDRKKKRERQTHRKRTLAWAEFCLYEFNALDSCLLGPKRLPGQCICLIVCRTSECVALQTIGEMVIIGPTTLTLNE